MQRRAEIIASIKIFKDATNKDAEARKQDIEELKREIEDLKREIEDFKGDQEELKRHISQFRQQSIDTASKHEADTAARFKPFEREIRGVLQDGTVGSISGRNTHLRMRAFNASAKTRRHPCLPIYWY